MTDVLNPYASNPAFSPLEAQVLNEYFKLSVQLKKLREFKKRPEQPHEQLLATLRSLEKKMGLVLTLYKASVWSTIIDSEAEQHAAQTGINEDEDSLAGQGGRAEGSARRQADFDNSGSEGDRTANAEEDRRAQGYRAGWS